jgi:hypothetical protein
MASFPGYSALHYGINDLAIQTKPSHIPLDNACQEWHSGRVNRYNANKIEYDA